MTRPGAPGGEAGPSFDIRDFAGTTQNAITGNQADANTSQKIHVAAHGARDAGLSLLRRHGHVISRDPRTGRVALETNHRPVYSRQHTLKAVVFVRGEVPPLGDSDAPDLADPDSGVIEIITEARATNATLAHPSHESAGTVRRRSLSSVRWELRPRTDGEGTQIVVQPHQQSVDSMDTMTANLEKINRRLSSGDSG